MPQTPEPLPHSEIDETARETGAHMTHKGPKLWRMCVSLVKPKVSMMLTLLACSSVCSFSKNVEKRKSDDAHQSRVNGIKTGVRVLAVSTVFETPCLEREDGDDRHWDNLNPWK